MSGLNPDGLGRTATFSNTESDSVNTEDTDSKQATVGVDLPINKINNTTDYDQEPHLAQLTNGTLVVVFREGAGHFVSDGRLVCQRSTDLGQSWSSRIEIANDGQDDRNPELVHDSDSDRLTVFYRSYDSNGDFEGIYYATSEDGGQSWSARTSLDSKLQQTSVAAFGQGIETSNGLMATFITEDGTDRHIEALFSTDNGQSWGSAATVVTETDTGFDLSEPVPCRIDDNRLMCFVRDDRRSGDEGGHVVVQSSDGGSSWSSGSYDYINPLQNDYATFLRVAVEANRLLGLACVRGQSQESGPLRCFEMSAELAWDDPGKIDSHAELNELAETAATDGTHSGYPDIVFPSNSIDGALVSFMDDDSGNQEPDIYVGSYSRGVSKITLFDDLKAEITSTPQTIPSGDWRKVEYDSAVYDENDGFDGTNNEYVARQDGKFKIKAQAHPRLSPFTSGDRFLIRIRKNGDTINRRDANMAGSDGDSITIDYHERLEKGDKITVGVFQESGGEIDIDDNQRTHLIVSQYRR